MSNPYVSTGIGIFFGYTLGSEEKRPGQGKDDPVKG
jgi:hypothetical protein